MTYKNYGRDIYSKKLETTYVVVCKGFIVAYCDTQEECDDFVRVNYTKFGR